MKLKEFFLKNWQHFFVIAVIFITAAVFYQPQLDGAKLGQSDVEVFKGISQEIKMSREVNDVEPLWTNNVFGGMPAAQISVLHKGNIFKELLNLYVRSFPNPIGQLILHLIGFYILALFLRISPIIGLIGAMAFSFASYELIIVQAGHNTKSMASAFLAPTLGAFIYAYRDKRLWGLLFASIFMSFELMANHLQITYYFIYMLIIVGIYFFIVSYKSQKLKSFLITSAGLIAAFVVAGLINYGNLSITSDYSKYTTRGENDLTLKETGMPLKSQGGGLAKAKILKWSYGVGETFTFISPNVKGGGSFALGGSQFEDIIDDSDFSVSEQKALKKSGAYWGEQPGTNGPVYLGAVILLLAFLGMIFIKDRIKWPLLATIILVTLLAWGSNFMWFSDLFIDYVPGYNMFRSITMILILAEVAVALLVMLFLTELVKDPERFRLKKKQMLIAASGFVAFILIIKMVGLGDNYMSSPEQKQFNSIESDIREQVAGTDPAILMRDYQVNINDKRSLDAFVSAQVETFEKQFINIKTIRSSIFHSSMNRTLIFLLLAGGLILLYAYSKVSALVLSFGVLLLTMIDLIPVAHDYIGIEERFWTDDVTFNSPTNVDEDVMTAEIALNPELEGIIAKAKKEGASMAESLELSGLERRSKIAEYRFFALNMNTNYRVFDFNGGYGSARASFWHKSLGGFHAAPLRSSDNMIKFHLGTMNEKAYDMLNVKYFFQETKAGYQSIPRKTAMGNAWFVQDIETHSTADAEIRGLGNSFEIENRGEGVFLVNDIPTTKSVIYGGEKLGYLMPGTDTLKVPIRGGLKVGEEAVFVMDAYGNTNLVPAATIVADTLNSFRQLVGYKVMTSFEPNIEAVMLETEADKLSTKKFTGEGTIKMDSYAPNKLTYTAKVKGKQFAVFSEIYYADGWKAFVDDKEVDILKTNYCLRGIEVPNGDHKIKFVYDLPKYHLSNTMAFILTLLLILSFGTLLFFEWKKRKEVVAEIEA